MKNDEYISKALILSKCEELWDNADETTELGRGAINAIDEITDYIETLPNCRKDMKQEADINGDY